MGIFDKLSDLTSGTNSDQMGQAVEEMVNSAIMRRKPHERRWYDNNFFDDGYHFRTISRKTGRVIDHVDRASGYVERAIPRASRQLRGVSNLLFTAEPYPVVYPERISMSQFMSGVTGQFDEAAYKQKMEQVKQIARKQGIWLANEWQDEQELFTKILDMILLSGKNSVSYLQVYSDPKKQKIFTEVFDAFEIVCYGEVRDLEDLPFITKTKSMDLDEIKTNPRFSPEKTAKLVPDNKYATSEIKEAYMVSRFGSKGGKDDKRPTVIQKETFLKEYLSDSNWEQATKLADQTGAMEGKSKGDMIMRQIFSAGGVTLEDSYIDYDCYPFADFRFEPGPLYQVPFIERFIPQNKSVDVIVTRLEKFVNAMVVGVYQRRKGENMQLSNFAGGQLIEYDQQPMTQMNVTNPGNAPFQVIQLLNQYIEEQGASTAALNQIPGGVKSGVAIESVKATEYANLKIPTLMLKKTIKKIAYLMLERASKDFLKPVEVSSIEDGEPMYFDVIGERGVKVQEKIGNKLPQDIVPISRKLKIRIEIEAGLGLTMEGKKDSAKQLIEYFTKLYELGFLSAEAMSMMVKRYVETLGYGSTEELMEAIENGVTQGQMSEKQIKQMQVAIAQVLQDTEAVGPKADEKMVMTTKVGALEAMKDAGILDKKDGEGMKTQDLLDNFVKIYKDSPADVRDQIVAALGLQPSNEEEISPSQADTASKINSMANENTKTELTANAQKESANLSQRDLDIKEKAASQKAKMVNSVK